MKDLVGAKDDKETLEPTLMVPSLKYSATLNAALLKNGHVI